MDKRSIVFNRLFGTLMIMIGLMLISLPIIAHIYSNGNKFPIEKNIMEVSMIIIAPLVIKVGYEKFKGNF